VTVEDLTNVSSRRLKRIRRLGKALIDRGTRHGYMGRHLKAFLAQQIRVLRGDESQTEFGERIGKPQSVVSRLEKQADRHISIQTLIDIAARLDIAVIIRFVDFATFLRYTNDFSDFALKPEPFRREEIEELIKDTEADCRSGSVLNAVLPITQIWRPSSRPQEALPRLLQLPANDVGTLSTLSTAIQ
jgi:hypothetical protein